MNIFFTSVSTVQCAREHCRVHRVKMILEYTQLLSTAHHVLDKTAPVGALKSTHEQHPSALWVRDNIEHYRWLHTLALNLCKLYRKYHGTRHKLERVLTDVLDKPPKMISKQRSWVDPYLAMPDKFKRLHGLLGTTGCYQAYLNEKFLEWRTRTDKRRMSVVFDALSQPPEWYEEVIHV